MITNHIQHRYQEGRLHAFEDLSHRFGSTSARSPPHGSDSARSRSLPGEKDNGNGQLTTDLRSNTEHGGRFYLKTVGNSYIQRLLPPLTGRTLWDSSFHIRPTVTMAWHGGRNNGSEYCGCLHWGLFRHIAAGGNDRQNLCTNRKMTYKVKLGSESAISPDSIRRFICISDAMILL